PKSKSLLSAHQTSRTQHCIHLQLPHQQQRRDPKEPVIDTPSILPRATREQEREMSGRDRSSQELEETTILGSFSRAEDDRNLVTLDHEREQDRNPCIPSSPSPPLWSTFARQQQDR
ncbi:hypothetical protein C0989_010940, partial [Termitomyces sp. Mn162]